jgi:hypothetical protein
MKVLENFVRVLAALSQLLFYEGEVVTYER